MAVYCGVGSRGTGARAWAGSWKPGGRGLGMKLGPSRGRGMMRGARQSRFQKAGSQAEPRQETNEAGGLGLESG